MVCPHVPRVQVHEYRVARRSAADGLFHVSDWLPTLYDLGGGDPDDLPDGIDGVSQASHLMGGGPDLRGVTAEEVRKNGFRIGSDKYGGF